MFHLGVVVSELVQLKYIVEKGLGAESPVAIGHGDLGAKPPPMWQFL